jgi:hypothetical protein
MNVLPNDLLAAEGSLGIARWVAPGQQRRPAGCRRAQGCSRVGEHRQARTELFRCSRRRDTGRGVMTTGNRAPGWRLLRFSDLVENVTERVDDPSQSGVKRYVGLEHLDAGSLAIRRWGSSSDVEATKLRFQPEDVIFGRRRAYQRKLAQADFEGICSAHAMVLRARPEKVLPEFLPFFMQSDGFFQRALSISVGRSRQRSTGRPSRANSSSSRRLTSRRISLRSSAQPYPYSTPGGRWPYSCSKS